ncbi:hypothetical protein A9Q99_27430 [Gammaproteobacteria bacterium 45_16_T64]|nr:hypothetical protein A9Q99_27430 [Gammaproteobacteria bacterium 45_16_T64]
MKISVANSESEISECQNVLREVFVIEHGFDLVIPDAHEPQSVYMYAHIDKVVIGALRIVIKRSGSQIPLEDVTEGDVLDGLGKVGEISRMAILPTYRGKTLNRSAYSECWELGGRYGLDNFIIEARYSIRSFHKRLGFVELGEPFYDPAMIEPGDSVGEPNAVIMVANVEGLRAKAKPIVSVV